MLTTGDRFTLSGVPYRVAYVNPGRAHCTSMRKRVVTVTDKHGKTRSFTATTSDTLDISPDTMPELLTLLAKGHL